MAMPSNSYSPLLKVPSIILDSRLLEGYYGKNTFCYVTSCSLVGRYWCFGEICFSETLVMIYQTTRCNTPEDGNL
jgi:hypothetical protein